MSFTEVEINNCSGWLCEDDLMLICDGESSTSEINDVFMDDRTLQSIYSSQASRKCRRYVPKVDFNDAKLFPCVSNRTMRIGTLNQSTREVTVDKDILSELDSMLACREYVSERNHYFDRKQFQEAQAIQVEEQKKLTELKKRQQEQSKMERQQRRRQHPLYVSRFDEKRYVPSLKKKLYKSDFY